MKPILCIEQTAEGPAFFFIENLKVKPIIIELSHAAGDEQDAWGGYKWGKDSTKNESFFAKNCELEDKEQIAIYFAHIMANVKNMTVTLSAAKKAIKIKVDNNMDEDDFDDGDFESMFEEQYKNLVSSKQTNLATIASEVKKSKLKTSVREKPSAKKDNSPALKDIKAAIAKLKKVKAVQTYITLAKRTARLYEAMNNSKKPKDNMPAIKANKAKMAKLAKMKSVSTLIKLVKKQSKLLGVV